MPIEVVNDLLLLLSIFLFLGFLVELAMKHWIEASIYLLPGFVTTVLLFMRLFADDPRLEVRDA